MVAVTEVAEATMQKTNGQNRKLRILLVEDDPFDIELTQAHLVTHNIACDLVAVRTKSAFEAELEQKPHLILSDCNVLPLDGMSALAIATKKCPLTPFVFLSGAVSEGTKAPAFAHGATDFVLKHDVAKLVSIIRHLCHMPADEG